MGNEYEEIVPKLCPGYDEALARFAKRTRTLQSVFELGVGTGNVAHSILQANPRIAYSGVDIDDGALNKARTRAKGLFYCANLTDVLLPRVDGIVSSLAIHHLTHSRQADLFSKISRVSKHFLHFELVAPETPEEARVIAASLDEYVEKESKKLGLSCEQLNELKKKSKHIDMPMKLSEHLRIHRELGAQVELEWKEYCFAFYSCLYP